MAGRGEGSPPLRRPSLVLTLSKHITEQVSIIITASKLSKEVQIKGREIQSVERIHFVNYENKQEAVRIFGHLCVQDDIVEGTWTGNGAEEAKIFKMEGMGGSSIFESGSRRLHSLP